MNDKLRVATLDGPVRISPPALVASVESLPSYLLYEATYYFGMSAMTLGFSLRTQGRDNVPMNGAVLLIANHQSYLDPLLVGLATRRHLCFLTRKTLFRHRLLARLINMYNAVPIDQEGVGKEGLKTIVEQLQRGRGVVIFPEGERTRDGVLHPLKPGIHLLVKRTEAAIVPVGIAGAYAAWPRWRRYPIPAPLFMPAGKSTLAVVVGQPLDSRRYANMSRNLVLEELFLELKKVQDQAESLRRKP